MVLRQGVFATSSAPMAGDDRGAAWAIADLVASAKLGDGDAYSHLYRRYLNDVYRFALTRLADREAAEDATQTIFYRAFASLAQCRDNAAFPGWLFAIARSVVADRLRARRFRSEPLERASASPDDRPGPEAAAEQGEARRLLREARETCLSARERDLFDLLLTDLNDKEIALALGRSHGAVRTAHWRLLSKLRDCLERPTQAGESRRTHG
jgi:RNA polymerase sigma-70 factor (ECF subfamily)